MALLLCLLIFSGLPDPEKLLKDDKGLEMFRTEAADAASQFPYYAFRTVHPTVPDNQTGRFSLLVYETIGICDYSFTRLLCV